MEMCGILLDVPAYEAEQLAGSENLAAFLMRMERAPLPTDLLEEVRRMRKALRAKKNANVRRDFSIFVSTVLLPKKTGKDFPEVYDLMEVERMIVEGSHEWAENWLKQGEERGIKLGEQRGIKLGEQRGIKLGEQRGISLGADRTKRENALRMLRKGLDVPFVAECVDLPEEEVRRLVEDTPQ